MSIFFDTHFETYRSLPAGGWQKILDKPKIPVLSQWVNGALYIGFDDSTLQRTCSGAARADLPCSCRRKSKSKCPGSK